MCRLYGFRANEPTKVECTLAYAQNALLSQSRADLRGKSHPDGWGIGFYEDSEPAIERRATAAYEDLHFSATAERMFAQTVVAHVRKATVGAADLANTHPFAHLRWMFIHNGTVRAFDRVRPLLEEETAPELLRLRRGTTDSELTFYWLLTRMKQTGIDLSGMPSFPTSVVDSVGTAVKTLDQWCTREGAERPAQLNFILTDGHILVASRWHNSLHWVEREGVHDCEICGIPHVRHVDGTNYRAVVIASEPITHEAWCEVPEGALLSVGDSTMATILPL
jgi:glutamine amidotransferase